jgi:hypothetical protein
VAGMTTSRPGLGSQVRHFTQHWLEMCVVMCVGGVILNELLFVAGPALTRAARTRRPGATLARSQRSRPAKGAR